MGKWIFLSILTIELVNIYRKVYLLYVKSGHSMDIWFFRLDFCHCDHIITVLKFWFFLYMAFKYGYHIKKRYFSDEQVIFVLLYVMEKEKHEFFFWYDEIIVVKYDLTNVTLSLHQNGYQMWTLKKYQMIIFWRWWKSVQTNFCNLDKYRIVLNS